MGVYIVHRSDVTRISLWKNSTLKCDQCIKKEQCQMQGMPYVHVFSPFLHDRSSSPAKWCFDHRPAIMLKTCVAVRPRTISTAASSQ